MRDPLSLYIHWPFCKAKCPYCDFNSHVREGVDQAAWKAALLAELAFWAQRLQGRRLQSIFFGGGTPSLMPPDTAAALIDAAAGYWSITDDVEITLEANPTSIEAGRFHDFRAAGINRVSVGIQALDDAALAFLGRKHSAAEAMRALESARIFPRWSFDLIYARPGQSLGQWKKELSAALLLAGDHLSLYQLTIEQNTAFYTQHQKGMLVMPPDDLAADLYQLTQEMMRAYGMPAYEISNHARPGAESRHNLAYWKSDDYVGIGPGAHGRVTLDGQRFATETLKSPERWLEKVAMHGSGLCVETPLRERERLEEAAMMGLRLNSGIGYADWRARTGLDMQAAFAPEAVATLVREGLAVADTDHIRVTPDGALLLNRVTQLLLA